MDMHSSLRAGTAAPAGTIAAPPVRSKNERAARAVPCAAAALLLALAVPGSAEAAKISIDIPGAGPAQTIPARYSCKGGAAFTAQYINVGGNSLAVLPVQGQTLIFAQGPSADGARYVSGFYAWWSKGDTGSLFDTRKGDNAPAILTCTAK